MLRDLEEEDNKHEYTEELPLVINSVEVQLSNEMYIIVFYHDTISWKISVSKSKSY